MLATLSSGPIADQALGTQMWSAWGSDESPDATSSSWTCWLPSRDYPLRRAESPCGSRPPDDLWHTDAAMSDPIVELDKRIAAAMAALHGARAAAWHSPNVLNVTAEELCENTLNDLLDCRLAMGTADGMVTA
jgi:hypothetical protein